MKQPPIPLIFLLLFSVSICHAQTGVHMINGMITDSLTAKGLEFVAISLTRPDSSRILTSTVTDSSGRFSFSNIASGKYSLRCSFIGYQKKKISVDATSDKKTISAGHILLSAEGKVLAEALILSEKPVIRFEPGKVIFDVAKTVTDDAETGFETMEKIPGVTVNQDGTVQVKGKSGVRYLVDGKPSPLAQSNPEAFLRSIPAKNIESIEVITTPSAKYDASGSAAVINIHLRKGKLEGLNASLSAGVGTVFDKYNASGNINYKKDKINIFANAYFRDEHSANYIIDDRQVTLGDSISRYHTLTSGKTHSTSVSGKAGIEYSMDKYNAITYSIDASMWQFAQNSNGNMTVMDYTTPTLADRLSQGSSGSRYISVTNSLNYRKTFDTADRSWTIDVAHTWQQEDGTNTTLSNAFDSLKNALSGLDFYSRSHNYGINQNILLQTDYTTPLKLKDTKIETGVKEELNLHNSHADVYSDLANPELKDSLQSSLFRYTESITAAYVVYSSTVKKFSYSGGLRWEQTYVRSDFSNVNQNYASLFPSGSIGWKFNDKNNINLSYSRRINRPPFWMLNNSVTYSSPYAVSSGNPNIKPSFSNSIEMAYNMQVGDQNFNLNASYGCQTGAFEEINKTDANQVTHSSFENAGTNDNAYLGLNMTFKFTKWWSASLYSGYGYEWFAYTQNSVAQRNRGGSLYESGNTTFKFWKTASVQLQGWGNTGWVSAQGKDKPVGSMGITVKKKFFKDKFTVALSCRDVFHTQIWRSTTFAPSLYDYNEYHYQSTVGYLTLTYQFGKETFTPETKGKSDRLSSGGGGK